MYNYTDHEANLPSLWNWAIIEEFGYLWQFPLFTHV